MNQAFDSQNARDRKIVDLSEFKKLNVKDLKKGKVVGLCHGNFDVLHVGHINHFEQARRTVDFLIVSITSDICIQKTKEIAVFNQDQRAQVLSALACIDLVVIVDDESSVPLIEELKPNYYFKGPDYAGYSDPSGRLKQEHDCVIKNGGEIFFTTSKKESSSKVIEMLENTSKLKFPQVEFELPDFELISKELKNRKILIIGETILDKYNSCRPLGKSAKHPIVAQQVVKSETHLGGALAIANHMAGLGCEVTVITNFNPSEKDLILKYLKNNVTIDNIGVPERPTITKTRYIDELTNTHLFETYEMDDTFLGRDAENELENYYLKSLKNADSVLIVDYGHGLISDEFLEFLKSKKVSEVSYVANAQANAGNLGLNSILRYEWCDSIVLNGSEVQLEMRQSKLGARKLLKNFSKRVITPNILITLGKNGLVYKSENGALIEKGAFSAEGIVDRTGAGDALLACYTVFHTLDITSSELLNFCNLGGYFSSRFVGNADSLTLFALYQITHSS